MARVLLIGSDRMYQENLATQLRTRGHVVEVANDCRGVTRAQCALRSSAEIVVVDVTQLSEDGRHQLLRICQQPREDGFPSLVLCYSRTNHGPQFELSIERLGARYVYAG